MSQTHFYSDHAARRGAWHRTLARIAATGACAALAACQSPGIVGSRTGATPGIVQGRVKSAGAESTPVVIVALDRASGHVAQRAYLPGPGEYAMPMTAGHYKLYAFADLDGNGTRGGGEPSSPTYSISGELRPGDRLELPALELRR
jgi:hypothetical protein